jgi:MFS family permease
MLHAKKWLLQIWGETRFARIACNDVSGEACILEMENAIFSPWKLLLILSSISIMVMYVETMLLPAIPDIIREFDISYSVSSWIFASFIISALISTTIVSKLSDIYGRKLILLIVLTIYIMGIIGGSLSNNIFWMIVFRIIQGTGMSMFPLVFAIVQTQFPKDKIAVGQGTLASMFAFGGVLGLMVGGNITHSFGWHMTFLSILPFAVVVTVVIKFFVNIPHRLPVASKEDKPLLNSKKAFTHNQKRFTLFRRMPNFDIRGTFVLAVTVTSFILALTLVQSEGTGNSLSNMSVPFSLLGVSVLSLFVFIVVERKTPNPLISLKLVALKPILLTNVIILIWGISTFAVFQTIPVLVRTPMSSGIGGNALDVVYVTLPFSIMSLIFGPTSGLIISKIGSFKVILTGGVITTIGFVSILMFHSDAMQIAISLAVIGSGLSLLNVGQININTASTPVKFLGISFGVSTLFRFTGSAIGPAVAGMLMQTNQISINTATTAATIGTAYGDNSTMTFPSAESFVDIFICMSILAAVTIFLSIMVKKHRNDKMD